MGLRHETQVRRVRYFQDVEGRVENETDLKVKYLGLDNGGEYELKEFIWDKVRKDTTRRFIWDNFTLWVWMELQGRCRNQYSSGRLGL